jgi:hypothetical protein
MKLNQQERDLIKILTDELDTLAAYLTPEGYELGGKK